jgi:hypothetical protein
VATGNYPYYGTSTKFMQMNGKPRHLPQLGEQSSHKVERASLNRKENLDNNQILIKNEKVRNIISNAHKCDPEEIEHEYDDKLRANLPGNLS